jgi:hypothetical protein
VTSIEFVAPWSPSLERVEKMGPRLPGRGDRRDPVYDFGDSFRAEMAAAEATEGDR